MTLSRTSEATVLALIAVVMVAPLLLPTVAGSTVMISGAGATFPASLMENWASTYHNSYPNVSISYNGIGSGAGVNEMEHGIVDFAASDLPLPDTQLQTFPGLTLFPETLGAIAVAYNVPGALSGLNFTSDVIVEIYNGTISRWNDARIEALNPSVTLPSLSITAVHRADASGATYVFTSYLAGASSWWASNVGSNTVVSWPTTSAGLAVSGDAGVAGAVSGVPGAIGYVGLSNAMQNGLAVGAVENPEGGFVAPSLQAIAYAAANATVVDSRSPLDLRQNIVNAAGAGSYPISTYSYIVVWKDMSMDPTATMDKAVALARFLWWAIHEGQLAAPSFSFTPLPSIIVRADETLLRFLTFSEKQLLRPNYLPGVLPGDEATYGSVSASYASNIPPSFFPVPSIIQPFLNTSSIGLLVETVSGSTVTESQTLNYPNGTSRSSTIAGDLSKEGGNLTFWTVAGGLHPGDQVYGSSSGMFGVPTINYTTTMTFAGVPRVLNVYNATLNLSGANVAIVACWDQATGILVSVDLKLSDSYMSPFGGTFYVKASGSARLTQTNLWSAVPDFKLNAGSLVWGVNSGSAQTIPLTVSSLGGFSGQVTIMPGVPAGIRVSSLNPASVIVPVNRSANSMLTISLPPSTAEGGYSMMVMGSDGVGISHTIKLAVNVVGDFAVSGVPSTLAVQTGTSVKVFIKLYSLGLSGRAGLQVSVSSGGLEAVVANSSLVLSPGVSSQANLTVTADRGTTLGMYTVTVTVTSGSVSHSTVETVTVTAGPVSASTSPSRTILGLDPPVFFGILAGVAVLAVAATLVVWRRRTSRTVSGPHAVPLPSTRVS